MNANEETVVADAAALEVAADIDQEHADRNIDLSGLVTGSFLLMERLGMGAFGAVYLARHVKSGKKAAVKLLRQKWIPDAASRTRFMREVSTMQAINHPAIVEILEVGQLKGKQPFYAMEYLDGLDANQLVRLKGRLSPAEVLAIMTPVCAALAAAHARDIVHRDLKPGNIHVGRDPNNPKVKLLDFGIAKLLTPDPSSPVLTTYGTQVGTATVMAPEQIRCEPVDGRTDIYGLGAVMYRLLVGKFPFVGPTLEDILRAHLEGQAPRPSASAPVPAALDAVILRCLAKAPNDRFATVQELHEALQSAIGAGSSKPATRRPGVGIFVQARARASATQDEDIDDNLADAIDECVTALEDAGYNMTLETGTSTLAVFLTDPPQLREQCDRAQTLAENITAELAATVPQVELTISVHCGDADVRNNAVEGGELAAVGRWATEETPGVHLTQAVRSLTQSQ